jgi:hypothetical protein
LVDWENHANHGAVVTINMHCLHAPYQNDFINDELWVGKYGTNNNWTEAGFTYGGGVDGRYFFWADNRPGHPYFEHDEYGLPANLDVGWDVYIVHRDPGSDIWDVYENLTYVGSSTDQFTSAANALQTGSETTANTAVRTDADSKNLKWIGAGHAYNSDWADGSSWSHLSVYGPGSAYNINWITQFKGASYDLNKSSC